MNSYKVPGLDGNEVTLTLKGDKLKAKHELSKVLLSIKVDVDAAIIDAEKKGAVDMAYLEKAKEPLKTNRVARNQKQEIVDELVTKKKLTDEEKKSLKFEQSEIKRLDKSYEVMKETYDSDIIGSRYRNTLRSIEELVLGVYYSTEGNLESSVRALCDGNIDNVDFSNFDLILNKLSEIRQDFFLSKSSLASE